MDFAAVVKQKLAISIARRKTVNFAAVAIEKPSHVYDRGEKWILLQLLRKKLAIFIARRKKVNFAADTKGKTVHIYRSKEKSGFCSKEKIGFCSIRRTWPYL